jgi:hypothetical protein
MQLNLLSLTRFKRIQMKALRYIFLLGSVGSLLTFSNCGGGGSTPEPVADQQFTKLSSKTWTVSSVTLDGTDRSAEYQAGVSGDAGPMKLTISGTKGNASTYAYAVAGRPVLSPWPKSGSWAFGTDPTQNVIRDPSSTTDKLSMNYAIDGTNLTISFSFSGSGYSNPRVGVVTGSWVFKFTGN